MHAETDRAGADARTTAGVRARAVVIAGPPASGKTTLGAALARALHRAFVDLDIVTGTMTRAALTLAGADETALHGELGDRLRDARYGALIDTAAANLGLGLGVVLSGPFTRERADPARWDALRTRLRCPDAALICLELDEGLRRDRMRARDAARDRAEPAVGDPQRRAASSDLLPPGAIRLDSAAAPDALLEAALAALSGPGRRNLPRAELDQPSSPSSRVTAGPARC
jgi:predicted kinase